MANPLAFAIRRGSKRFADFLVSNPIIRWVWTGPGNEDFGNALSDFRPSDRESLLEIMQGRYLLASKLVDTNGASPFAIDMVNDDWLDSSPVERRKSRSAAFALGSARSSPARLVTSFPQPQRKSAIWPLRCGA